MCGRYVAITKVEAIEKRFGVSVPNGFSIAPNPNVSPGELAPAITSDAPRQLSLLRFGLTPAWSKKPMWLINARAEGDHNSENDYRYAGAMGILQKPAFRSLIRTRRCLIPADAFFEGPEREKLSKPFLVYQKDGAWPFAFAGIWDTWQMPQTGEIVEGFAIVTTPANAVLRKIGHPRCPLILSPANESIWLDTSAPLSEITTLMRPVPDNWLNAYRVSAAIKSPSAKQPELLRPQGERVIPEYTYELYDHLDLEGMGQTTSRRLRNDGVQGELF
jgi:putative SOS response-associated peptidase YedK